MSEVTAILPVLDTDPEELLEAIGSLERSRLASAVILVDDNSTDRGTLDALRHLRLLPHIQVISAGRRRKTAFARAYGVHHAKTPYILNMDSDDLIYNDGLRKDDLAPINIARQNTPWSVPDNIWDFIDDIGAIQWGSIVRTDLARTLALEKSAYGQEDIGYGFRLLIAAWRDRLPVARYNGVRYFWRDPDNRPRSTVTTRVNRKLSKAEHVVVCDRHFEQALESSQLCEQDIQQLRQWKRRRTSDPIARTEDHGARIDTHILSYSGSMAHLVQAVESLRDGTSNIHLVLGGFNGSIGRARAYAFGLGTAEYVCFLDDDDYALPGAMQQCIDYLDSHPECVGVYTDRYHLHLNGALTEQRLHPWHWRRMYHNISEVTHLKVMRRSTVKPYLEDLKQWSTWEEYVLCCLMAERGDWHHLPIFGAVKRMNTPDRSSMRLDKSNLMLKAMKYVKPRLKERFK